MNQEEKNCNICENYFANHSNNEHQIYLNTLNHIITYIKAIEKAFFEEFKQYPNDYLLSKRGINENENEKNKK